MGKRKFKIKNKYVVSFCAVMRDKEGSLLAQNSSESPLSYIQGVNDVMPGLTSLLENKQAGDEFEALFEPDEAFGERNEELVQKLPIEMFENIIDQLHLGEQFILDTSIGKIPAFIKEINKKSIIIDINSPLAGKAIHIKGKITDVRKATEAELITGVPG